MALLPVEEALSRVLKDVGTTAAEDVTLQQAWGRTLAADVSARLTQPPFDGSAMDGYAGRGLDLAVGARLKVVGESQAGSRYTGTLAKGTVARIFTGAPLPAGADTVIIQEDVDRSGDTITVREVPEAAANVRKAGNDFRVGASLLAAGTPLDASAITLAAAAGHASLKVRRRPRVAVLATGNELIEPGREPGPDQVISSNPYGLAALIERAGGTPELLGIAPDEIGAISDRLRSASGADVLVTIGGASVGDHDLVRPALEKAGMALDFWKIAMRPGKPMLFGRLGDLRVLGLPGNPLSCLITARMFLVPLLYALLGRRETGTETWTAALTAGLPANGPRQHYIAARLEQGADGILRATALPATDSARLTGLAGADAFIVRTPGAAAAEAGTLVPVLPAKF
jgi:molybdopterin molybdotransferase